MVFQKTVGKRRLVDTHTKPKNRKDANPIRYFQNLKIARKRHLVNTCKFSKKPWRRNISVDIHNSNFKTKNKKGLEKPQISKNRGEATFHRYPQNKIFEKKARRRHSVDTCTQIREEATFHRYSQPNEQGSDIPSILAIPFSREATLSRYLHFLKPKTRLSHQNPAFMPKTWLSCQKPKSGFHANKTKTWLSCQK